jgi:hypothetical protein
LLRTVDLSQNKDGEMHPTTDGDPADHPHLCKRGLLLVLAQFIVVLHSDPDLGYAHVLLAACVNGASPSALGERSSSSIDITSQKTLNRRDDWKNTEQKKASLPAKPITPRMVGVPAQFKHGIGG